MQYLAEPHQIGQQIIKTILNHQDSQTMFSAIAMQLGELFGVDICAILSGEANYAELSHQGLWRKQKYLELESEKLDRVLLELFVGDCASRTAVDNRETCTESNRSEVTSLEAEIVNFQSYPANSLSNRLSKILSVKSILAIKLRVSKGANGVILLGKERSYDWDSAEEELLKSVSESVAIAISQVHLQQQARTQAKYQKAIEEISVAISQNTDTDRLFELALTKTAEALQVDRGSILMLKYKQPHLSDRNPKLIGKATAQISCYWSKIPTLEASDRKHSFEVSESALTQAAWQKAPQALAIGDRAHFPDLNNNHFESVFNANTAEALLMMPLMGNVSNDPKPPLVLGFLVLQHNSPRLWRTEEVAIVNWMSIQIGTALIHSQTINRVQSVVDERTSRLKWSVDVQAKLSEKMRQQIDQLRQLNDLKDDFLNSISHELKTPLTSMKMAIKMLRQPGLPEASKEKYLNILEQEWNREYNLIKDLLTLQQVESENFKIYPQELNLEKIISQLAESFQQKWQTEKDLTLAVTSVQSPLTLYTDSESLQQILEELLLNAGKYSDPDTTVNLQVNRRITSKSPQIEITVTNQGTGISQQELPNIFDKFRRGKGVTDRAVPGTGLGLTLVKYLVEHLNGTIDVSSTPLEDSPSTFVTAFTVTLPQLFSPK